MTDSVDGDSDMEEFDTHGLTPEAILEALAPVPTGAVVGGPQTDEAINTRRLLGMPVPAYTIKDPRCPHTGTTVEDSLLCGKWAPGVFDLGTGQNVLGALQSALRGIESQGTQSWGEAWRMCPLCDENGNQQKVDVHLNWARGTPDTFFARVGVPPLAERKERGGDACRISDHVVNFCGGEYCLCGVVYRISAPHGSRFVSQTFYDDGWWTYVDTKGGALERTRNQGSFDSEFYAGSESLLMFVRTNIVEKRFGEVFRPSPVTSASEADEV